jgi:uncharacterized protein (DUF1330 family)
MTVKTSHATALAIGCFLFGGLGVQALHSQPAKTAFFVVNEVDVKDQAAFQKYADANFDLIKKNGGKYVVRGGKVVEKVDGAAPAGRYTVYRFETKQQLDAWQKDSAEIRKTRGAAATFRTFIVEGPE